MRSWVAKIRRRRATQKTKIKKKRINHFKGEKMKETIELRALSIYDGDPMQLRIEKRDGKPNQLVGYAIRFNSLSKDLGGFRERIMPGAVDKAIAKSTDVLAIASGDDIRALYHHDAAQILGRTSAGTLRIGKDDRGLWFNVDMPDTQYARDLQTLVERGDVRGMSFGFRVPKGGEKLTRDGGEAIREVHSMDLKEITVTSIPAYTDTSLHIRVDPTLADRLPPIPTPIRDAAARTVSTII
jgi:hypothetical protein